MNVEIFKQIKLVDDTRLIAFIEKALDDAKSIDELLYKGDFDSIQSINHKLQITEAQVFLLSLKVHSTAQLLSLTGSTGPLTL